MATTTPYNVEDTFLLHYPEGEYSLERVDKTYLLKASDITHVVIEGETLQSIAFKYYRDSGRWGDIATINDIVDPFNIAPGMNLIIPL